jgi:hypothetical protein
MGCSISILLMALSSGVAMVGAVAQLGEHLLCKQGVSGSIPLSSTNSLWCRDGGSISFEEVKVCIASMKRMPVLQKS